MIIESHLLLYRSLTSNKHTPYKGALGIKGGVFYLKGTINAHVFIVNRGKEKDMNCNSLCFFGIADSLTNIPHLYFFVCIYFRCNHQIN